MRKAVALLTVWALLAGSLLVGIQPAAADTAGRPDDPIPDEIYYDAVGPAYEEVKGSGGSSPAKILTVGVSGQSGAAMLAGAAAAQAQVTFPYSQHNWTINSWYSTNDGLRFYGAYYKNEQILYDYRVPWIKLNGVRFALNGTNLVSGPNLENYYSGMFLVKAYYNLRSPNVDVTVVTRFYWNGQIDPWVLVNTNGINMNIVVPQKFDFDLNGLGDDNQQYYNGTAWRYTGLESDNADSQYGEDPNGNQWRTFDTDQQGGGYVVSAEVFVKPYHPDSAKWYHLAYLGTQTSGDPSGYESGDTINTYNQGAPDPWVGADAVNWYVSSYTGASFIYPGPWLKVTV